MCLAWCFQDGGKNYEGRLLLLSVTIEWWCMLNALRNHWPEYLMEGAGLGVFGIPALEVELKRETCRIVREIMTSHFFLQSEHALISSRGGTDDL